MSKATAAELSDIVKSIRAKTPKGWLLLSSNSSGEVLIICALARSMIEKYGYPITLCVRPEHVEMVQALYPDRFAAVIPMHQSLMRSFSESGYLCENQFDVDTPIHLSPLHYHSDLLVKLHNLLFKRQGTSGLNMTDVFRCMMRIDWDAPIERPCMDFFAQDNPILGELGLEIENESPILFQPGNNTNKPLPASFWHAIEEKYRQQSSLIFANYKGAILVDRAIRFQSATSIELDIMDALYLAYHSKTVVSVMNGLVNAAIFLNYSEASQSPLIHGINTDKYCAYYDRLKSDDWDSAFVDFPGPPSTWLGGREGISEHAQFCEWKISTELSEDQYTAIASEIFELDRHSSSYLCSHLENSSYHYPKPVLYASA